MVSWLIVGGGPHGVHVAACLVANAGVDPRDLAIVDPRPELLDHWAECARRTGMTHLRSPSVHHLDLDPWSLRRFANDWSPDDPSEELFRPPYSRPSVPLFAAHSRFVIRQYCLDECHRVAKVTALRPQPDGSLRVDTDGGEMEARRVVLALGSGGAQAWPEWARPVRDACPSRIGHIFDPGFNLDHRQDIRSVAVVGGGITGAQLALRLHRLGKRVVMVCRHRLRRQQFDSDPTWLGPTKMGPFARLDDPAERRRVIDRARHRGSMPAEVHRDLRSAISRREVRVIRSPIRGCLALRDAVVLGLKGQSLEVDAVALATGFSGVPDGGLLDGLRAEDGFLRAPCGTPCVDELLHWHAGVHCTGALAELELGPVARNLAGARRAGERLSAAASRAPI